MTAAGRQDASGGASALQLFAAITDPNAFSFQATGTVSGWVFSENFTVTIDANTPSEEKILCSALNGTVPTIFTVVTRGYDGTVPTTHGVGAPVTHTLPADIIMDVERHIYATAEDDHTQYLTETRHSIPALHEFGTPGSSFALGAGTTTPAPIGTAASPGSGTSPARDDHAHDFPDGVVTSAKIADGTIVTGDLADGSVTSAKIVDGTIVTADLADGAVTSAKIADATIVTADLADASVATAKIVDAAVTTAKIADASITAAKFEADVWTQYTVVATGVVSYGTTGGHQGFYRQEGKTVFIRIQLHFAGAGISVPGFITAISLPVTPANRAGDIGQTLGALVYGSGGGRQWDGAAFMDPGGAISQVMFGGNDLSGSYPIAIIDQTDLLIQGIYEAA